MGLKELLKAVARELEQNKIDYMIIGGQAVLIYGEPRLTKDIDITIGGGLEKIGDIINMSKKLGLKILPENPYEFAQKTMVIPLLDEKTGLRVDIIFSFSEYEKEALKRVKKVKIDDVILRYVSVDDLVIHKIVSGRERDIEDVKSVLLKNKVDDKYIKRWLGEFGKMLGEDLLSKYERVKKELGIS